MIIAFYPGGGGNRYRQYVLGKDWNKLNKSYDQDNVDQLLLHRYLLDAVPASDSDELLTHCMHSEKIQQAFPNEPIVFINTNLQQSLRRQWMLHGHEHFMNKKIKSTVSRIDHYRDVKDPAWPDAHTIEDLDRLPQYILQELISDYNQVISNVVPVPGTVAQLTQQYLDKINSAYETIVWHKDYYQKYPVNFSQAEHIIDVETGHDEFSLLMKQELCLHQSELFDQVWAAVNNE